jgi:hypothetical protein
MPAKKMTPPEMTAEDLIEMFRAKAAAPPLEASQMLARHLQCRESLQLAHFVIEAMNRYSGTGSEPLAAPSEMLPPLA